MIAEQLFSMEAPESTRGTQDISKVVFNKDQVAAKLDISKDDVAHAHRLSRALGVAGAVCPERGPMLREMQTGLSEAIEVTADTFTEGTSLRIATWSSRAQTVSLSVFPAVEVPNNLREIIRTGASRTSPFGSSSAIGKETLHMGRVVAVRGRHVKGARTHGAGSGAAQRPIMFGILFGTIVGFPGMSG